MATHSTDTSHLDTHPDLVSLRDRHTAMSHKPVSNMLEGLCIITGLYLAISPWVIGFQNFSQSLRVTNLIMGIALAVLGFSFGSVLERAHGLGWVVAAIGVWTIIAPWVVSGHPVFYKIIWNNSFTGGVAVLVGLATMALGLMATRRLSRRS
ncbi:SPW repeat protein [Streptomyces sp. NBC_01190]|uniref:SPW repeat protein n=1 Tax=Streptomyces sp. NBC_01190 TaxID=2903767 RepID=UPI003863571A|nr:SPW repeat protein [Streptomyces sp. NBC_01190]